MPILSKSQKNELDEMNATAVPASVNGMGDVSFPGDPGSQDSFDTQKVGSGDIPASSSLTDDDKKKASKIYDFLKYNAFVEESVNEGLAPGYAKFLVSLQTLIGDIAPNAWGNKSQITPSSVKRVHNSLKKRYGDDYAKFNDLLKTQKGQFGNWYLKESVNEAAIDGDRQMITRAIENMTSGRLKVKDIIIEIGRAIDQAKISSIMKQNLKFNLKVSESVNEGSPSSFKFARDRKDDLVIHKMVDKYEEKIFDYLWNYAGYKNDKKFKESVTENVHNLGEELEDTRMMRGSVDSLNKWAEQKIKESRPSYLQNLRSFDEFGNESESK